MAIFPTLSPQKSLDALNKQLEALQKIKGRTYIEAETEKTAWEHMTRSIIEAAYGEKSSELTRFDQARYQGAYNIRGMSSERHQANFDSQVSDLDGLLNALINVLRLQLPEEEIKGAYDAGDEYGFYLDLSTLIAAAKSKVFFIDAYLDEELFHLYVSKVPNAVAVQILCKKIGDNVKEVGLKFAASRVLNIRSSKEFHDRVIFIDGRGWVIGQSIKDAAKKMPAYLIEISEPMLNATESAYNRIWESATVVI